MYTIRYLSIEAYEVIDILDWHFKVLSMSDIRHFFVKIAESRMKAENVILVN
jgi:hypothetical protein